VERHRIVVVGGGIAGLTVGYELLDSARRLKLDLELQCLEAADQPGGNIRTTREGEFLCEWGATGFLDNAPATIALVRRLGLEDRCVKAREAAARRYIVRKGRLREVPLTPSAFLTSDVLSPRGKLRLMLEPFVPQLRDRDRDESVHAFASRRIGHEAANVLVNAMVGGVYAGDDRQLSLRATFPRMHEMESQHRSLFRAMLARRREARRDKTAAGGPAGPGGRLTSFREGLAELIQALAAALGPRLHLGRPVVKLSHLGQRGYRVHPREGAPIEADAVILACPSWVSAELVHEMDGELSRALGAIPSAAIAVVHAAYRREALGPHPEGFGFLVPRGAGLRILGALWPSNLFDGRAPAGSLLTTVMLGGATDPYAARLNDDKLLAIVREDLRALLNVLPDPYFVRIFRHRHGIPQYTLGHVGRVATVDRRVRDFPGLAIIGNCLRGISINACVEQAPPVAAATMKFLQTKRTKRGQV